MIILEAMKHVRIMRIIIEVIEYIVPDDLLEELGIDEMTYDELKALFELFDLDRWHRALDEGQFRPNSFLQNQVQRCLL